MANEISVQASLTFQRDTIALQASGTRLCDQTGSKGLLNQVSVGTSATVLFDSGSPPLASLGYIFVKNIATGTTTPTVQVSFDSGFGASAIISTLKPGEFCLLAPNRTTLATFYAKASAASTPTLVGITEC